MIHATNSVPHARDPPQMVSVMEINVTQKQNSNKSFLKKAGKHGTINDMNGVRWMLCEHSEIGNVLELTHTLINLMSFMCLMPQVFYSASVYY